MPRPRRRSVKVQEVVVASAARTTTGNSGPFGGWSRGGGDPQSRLAITAVGGTPNLVLTIEDSPDGTTWTVRDTYPAQTGIATVTRALPLNMAQFQRVLWTITGGTPSLTFSVQFASSTATLV
jgi:hypothetical protein